jgi:REP element-mobilizing transposase RayT
MQMPVFQVSRDNQALFITLVARNRLAVFRSEVMKKLTGDALNEARQAGGFLIFAYVVMPDHLHLITSQTESSAKVLRYLKGWSPVA